MQRSVDFGARIREYPDDDRVVGSVPLQLLAGGVCEAALGQMPRNVALAYRESSWILLPQVYLGNPRWRPAPAATGSEVQLPEVTDHPSVAGDEEDLPL